VAGVCANPAIPKIYFDGVRDEADRLLSLTKQRWPDEQLSGNSPELPVTTCSPRCDAVTPLAAGDETVTEPDPGEGYRWLKVGETIKERDQWLDHATRRWELTNTPGWVCKTTRHYRRRIDAAPETTPRGDEVRSEVRSEPVDDGGVDAIMERIKNGTSTNDDARILAMRLRCADAGIAGWREATEKADAQVERLVKDVEQLRASRHALALALTTARGFIPKKHGFGVLEDVHQMIDETLREHGGAA
jgi:hypothetical protein